MLKASILVYLLPQIKQTNRSNKRRAGSSHCLLVCLWLQCHSSLSHLHTAVIIQMQALWGWRTSETNGPHLSFSLTSICPPPHNVLPCCMTWHHGNIWPLFFSFPFSHLTGRHLFQFQQTYTSLSPSPRLWVCLHLSWPGNVQISHGLLSSSPSHSCNCSLLANILHSKCRWNWPSCGSTACCWRRRYVFIHETVSKIKPQPIATPVFTATPLTDSENIHKRAWGSYSIMPIKGQWGECENNLEPIKKNIKCKVKGNFNFSCVWLFVFIPHIWNKTIVFFSMIYFTDTNTIVEPVYQSHQNGLNETVFTTFI